MKLNIENMTISKFANLLLEKKMSLHQIKKFIGASDIEFFKWLTKHDIHHAKDFIPSDVNKKVHLFNCTINFNDVRWYDKNNAKEKTDIIQHSERAGSTGEYDKESEDKKETLS